MLLLRIWIVLSLGLLLVLAACGDDGEAEEVVEPTLAVSSSGITVRDAWIRPAVLPEGSPTQAVHDHDADGEMRQGSGVISAMYLVIENGNERAVQLTSIETSAARITEIHETQNDDGMLRMRPVQSVDVPGDGQAAFEPGGMHVMLIDVVEDLDPGDTVPVTLIFDTGERLELPDVPVVES